MLSNNLYLNKQLFIFNNKDTKLCSYCIFQDETTNHIFVECIFTVKLWSHLRHHCQCSFDLSILNPKTGTFGFFEIDPDLVTLLNHILLLYKYYIYSSRDSSKKIVRKWKNNNYCFIKTWSEMMQLGNFMN